MAKPSGDEISEDDEAAIRQAEFAKKVADGTYKAPQGSGKK